MSGLSLEVMFTIFEETEIDNVLGLSLVDTEFRKVFQDLILWKRIFSRHNLTILKKSKRVTSWVLNFQNSLVSKRVADNIMKKLDKIRNLQEIIKPITLTSIKDVSIIHVPKVTKKDHLEMFILMDRLCCRKNKNLYSGDVFQGINNKYKDNHDFSYTDLCLEKKEANYYMTIEEVNLRAYCDNVERARYKLDREQVSFLLYKLSYYSLLSVGHKLKQRRETVPLRNPIPLRKPIPHSGIFF
nr:hypothetical protein Cduv_320 [Cedratvirus duvanny]